MACTGSISHGLGNRLDRYGLILEPTSELQNGLGPLAERETSARPGSDLHCLSGQVPLPKPSKVYDMGVSEDM